jgi:DNA-binding beta-propeller fold protein YncE
MGVAVGLGLGLSVGSAAASELQSGGHVFVLGVNGSFSARNPTSLKTGSQVPDAGAIALSGNRRRLFGMESGVGRVFEINTRTLISTPIIELKQPLGAICANPDGSRLLLSSIAKKTLHLVDTATKQATVLPVDGKAIRACLFSADGALAYVIPVAAEDALIVDIKGGKVAGKLAPDAARPTRVTQIVLHPNPTRKLGLIVAGAQIFYFDTATNKLIGAATTLGAPIHDLAIHPDGARIFALAHENVFIVDLQTRAVQKTLELRPGAFFRSLAIDSQGKRLFIAGNHETDGGVGSLLNKDGKEFLAFDLDTGKKTYEAFPPVQTVQFIITP